MVLLVMFSICTIPDFWKFRKYNVFHTWYYILYVMGLVCTIRTSRKLATPCLSWTLKQPQLISQNSRQLFLIYSKFSFKWWEKKWQLHSTLSQLAVPRVPLCQLQWDRRAAFCYRQQKIPAIPLLCRSSPT